MVDKIGNTMIVLFIFSLFGWMISGVVLSNTIIPLIFGSMLGMIILAAVVLIIYCIWKG